ncbi:hypothetical protein [Bacillus cereus]|uniref:hypothetical protein n=1 Tax=Bacillus cereus TaxID=1396 RepID=UPI0018F664E2|nr:hypothetical protein [Bacillus cereus]MBJ8025708.1 hypothetical protein [Bacillus cereus]MBJ8038056.1 hypothetical protein [Bacillus cereus]
MENNVDSIREAIIKQIEKDIKNGGIKRKYRTLCPLCQGEIHITLHDKSENQCSQCNQTITLHIEFD